MRPEAFILAAGTQQRWPLRSPPKQLLHVGDERILLRMQRQLRNRRVRTTLVTAHPGIISATRIPPRQIKAPKDNTSVIHTLLSTRHLWSWRTTIILLGDVVYSKSAMDLIVAHDGNYRFFGRRSIGETFAISFNALGAPRIAQAAQRVLEYGELRQPDNLHLIKLGGVYKAIIGLDQTASIQQIKETNVFYEIDDYTNDIDTPEEYASFCKQVVDRGQLDDLPTENS